jgi:hypothetical protein
MGGLTGPAAGACADCSAAPVRDLPNSFNLHGYLTIVWGLVIETLDNTPAAVVFFCSTE